MYQASIPYGLQVLDSVKRTFPPASLLGRRCRLAIIVFLSFWTGAVIKLTPRHTTRGGKAETRPAGCYVPISLEPWPSGGDNVPMHYTDGVGHDYLQCQNRYSMSILPRMKLKNKVADPGGHLILTHKAPIKFSITLSPPSGESSEIRKWHVVSSIIHRDRLQTLLSGLSRSQQFKHRA